jgi:hypothetical protein
MSGGRIRGARCRRCSMPATWTDSG